MSEEDKTQEEMISLAEYNKAQEKVRNLGGKLTDLEKKLEEFSGIDLVGLKADREALRNLEKERAQGSGKQEDLDALIAAREKAVRDELQPNLEKYENDLKSANSKIRELTIVDKGFSKISSQFNDDTHDFIKDLVRKNVDLDEEGNFIVKDKDGKVRYSQGSANKPMSLDEYGAELAQKHPSFAKPTTTSGGRQNGTQTSGGSTDVQRYLRMTPEQRRQLPMNERHKLAQEAVKNAQ